MIHQPLDVTLTERHSMDTIKSIINSKHINEHHQKIPNWT